MVRPDSESDDTPPDLSINEDGADEDSDDDGSPPPILERQDEPDHSSSSREATPPPSSTDDDDSMHHMPRTNGRHPRASYTSDESEEISPAAKSMKLIEDPNCPEKIKLQLLCILCQRACNVPHVMNCKHQHRFCKSCIFTRWNKGNYCCPRCGDLAVEEPTYDRAWEEIIRGYHLNLNVVHYIPREVRNSTDSEDEYFDMYHLPMDERRELRRKRRERKRVEIRVPKDPQELGHVSKHPDSNMLIRKYMKKAGIPVCSEADIVKIPQKDVIDRIAPIYKHNRKVVDDPPIHLQLYKRLDCNKGHKWPNPPMPRGPLGLPYNYLSTLPTRRKRARLAAEEKSRRHKAKLQMLTELREEKLKHTRTSNSSSDEEESLVPPKMMAMAEPPKISRRPDDDDDMEAMKQATETDTDDEKPPVLFSMLQRTRSPEQASLPTTSTWGAPVLLVRYNKTLSSIPTNFMKRCYVAVPEHASIAHIKEFIITKAAQHLDQSEVWVENNYDIELYPVESIKDGHLVSVLKADEQAVKMASSASQQSPFKPTNNVPTMVTRPLFVDSNRLQPDNTIMGTRPTALIRSPPTFSTSRIFASKLIPPYSSTNEPTVREVAMRAVLNSRKETDGIAIGVGRGLAKTIIPKMGDAGKLSFIGRPPLSLNKPGGPRTLLPVSVANPKDLFRHNPTIVHGGAKLVPITTVLTTTTVQHPLIPKPQPAQPPVTAQMAKFRKNQQILMVKYPPKAVDPDATLDSFRPNSRGLIVFFVALKDRPVKQESTSGSNSPLL